MGRQGVAGEATSSSHIGVYDDRPISAGIAEHPAPALPLALSAQSGLPWPIPRRRFEMSTIVVSEFACMLLIAPFYLISGHSAQMYSWHVTDAAIFHTATTQSIEAIELALGILAMLTLPFFPRRKRSTLMVTIGLASLGMVFFLSRQQGPLMIILTCYPAVALLALVGLDALTGIRPAVGESETFNTRLLVLGSTVIILWFLPTLELFTCRTVDTLVASPHYPWVHLLLVAAMLGAQGAGVIALAGYFSRFNRWVNITGRLCGTLALTVTMGMGLWCAMRDSELIGRHQQWMHPELLWIFMLISAGLLLVWSGLTQKFILAAAGERGEAE